MEYRIRPLKRSDNRKEFKSGQADLDHFFKRYAGQNQFRHHIGVTYVATNEDGILGYMTVAMGVIAWQNKGRCRLETLHRGFLMLRWKGEIKHNGSWGMKFISQVF